MTPDERLALFLAKVDAPNGVYGCWLWTACTRDGYGVFWSGAAMVGAHRWAYEQAVGPVPAGLMLDHLCRRRACVNPFHVEPVTNRENTLRGESFAAANATKTQCPQGHPYDDANTYVVPSSGYRLCRRCNADRQARYRGQKKSTADGGSNPPPAA